MDILVICGVAVVTAVLALMLRTQSPQSAMLLSVAAGVIIMMGLISRIPSALDGVSNMLVSAGIESADVAVLFKVMGICFVTEFTCDCVTEAGLLSLSTNISFAGKILVLLTSLPLFERIVTLIGELNGG